MFRRKLFSFNHLSLLILVAVIMLTGVEAARARNTRWITDGHDRLIVKSEKNASPEGQRILAQAWKMSVETEEIIRGSCWNFINAVYQRAGFTGKKKRKTVFKSRERGPYANVNAIEAGDWLYYVNHSYGEIPHSGIFVGWVNQKAKSALIFSYGGEQRNEPARYRRYDLSSVYSIIRPVDPSSRASARVQPVADAGSKPATRPGKKRPSAREAVTTATSSPSRTAVTPPLSPALAAKVPAAWYRALMRGDPGAAAALFLPQGSLVVRNQHNRGPAAVESRLRDLGFAESGSQADWNQELLYPEGQYVRVECVSAWTRRSRRGSNVTRTERARFLLEAAGGEWRILQLFVE